MENKKLCYLCGGTFLVQLLGICHSQSKANDYIKGQKKIFAEREVFRRLLLIFNLNEVFIPDDKSLKTCTSEYKNCKKSLDSYTKFSVPLDKTRFDHDTRSDNSVALKLTSAFVSDFLDLNKLERFILCILDMIENDKEIDENSEFYINRTNTPVKKSELKNCNEFFIEPFILGIWHFIIMNRPTENKKGIVTYDSGYLEPQKNICHADIDLNRKIIVKHFCIDNAQDENPQPSDTSSDDTNEQHSDTTIELDETTSKTHVQYINNATIVNQTGENNVHIENLGILNL